MSLDYDLTKIADSDNVCFVKVKGGVRIRPLTEALIFFTVVADIGKITEKNAREFATRLRAYELVCGAICASDNEELTPESAVRAHIGLETNVFPTGSRLKFGKKLARVLMERAEKSLKADAAVEKERLRRQVEPVT
jgi:hypothetical protein